MRLWIDTDVGTNVDDAIALLAAAAHPQVELVGVSTVGDGLGHRAGVARSLLFAAGLGHAPVVAGPPPPGAGDADVLLAIGPLTNVAALGAERPPLTVMGGLLAPVRHRGAVRTVEHNFGADPTATAAVLAHPGATVVPLDVTVATRLAPGDQTRLVEAAPILGSMVEGWLVAQGVSGVPEADRAVHLHDPAALLVAAGDPAAGARTERLGLAVAPDGRLMPRSEGGAVHDVVVELDAAGVTGRVLGLLRGQAGPARSTP